MANIVINDGATTPVSRTFSGQQAQGLPNTFAVWYEKLVGFSTKAWPSIKTRVALSFDDKKEHVAQLQTIYPIVSVVDGAEVTHGKLMVFTTMTASYGVNSETNLKTVWGLHKNALAHAEATGVFVTQKPSVP